MKELIRKVLTESISERKKQSLFKLWDREKAMGKKPSVNMALAKSLGFRNTYIISTYLIEWYGGVEKVFDMIKNKLENKIFSTNLLEQYGLQIGGYDFIFKIKKFEKQKSQSGGYDINIEVQIVEGGVELMTTGEYIDLTKNIEDDDLNWEIYNEIRDLILDFVSRVTREYGFDEEIDNINFQKI